MKSFLAFIILSFVLSGCTGLLYDPDKSIDLYLAEYQIGTPQLHHEFETCHHYNCDGVGEVYLSQEDWEDIRALFKGKSRSAKEERESIAEAVALFEERVGKQNNTDADQACNNFREPITSYQLDCVAETVNTTIYLLLLKKQHLLHWHDVSFPASRDVAGILFQHYSAVIEDRSSGALFAVDSWFYPNGNKATIVPLHLWRQNYFPEPCS